MIRAKTIQQKQKLRLKRKKSLRAKIFGTNETPRVSVFKSNKYIYAQAINDEKSITICSADSRALKIALNKESAKQVGAKLAEQLKANNISRVVFDRNGYKYHGVIASLADAIRDNNIQL